MKKFLYIITAGLLLSACAEDFLEKQPLDKMSEADIFSNAALATAYANSFYTVLEDTFTEANMSAITDESWYIVRNTKGVTGFVGPGSKPVPLTDDEVRAMGVGLEEPKIAAGDIDLEIGDAVEVSNGAFAGQVGTVEEINVATKEIKVSIDAFGKKTLFTVELDSIEKI